MTGHDMTIKRKKEANQSEGKVSDKKEETRPDCAIICNLINTQTRNPEGLTRNLAAEDNHYCCRSSLPGGDWHVASPFPFHGARIYVSPVWPWWDFWGLGRWHGPSPAGSGQQRASKHGEARGQS